jgi:Na+/melibiose symporter-like transporter
MISRATVWSFGAGGVALGIVGNAVSYFLLVYYNQVLGLPAYAVSLALAIALVVDAFVDPVVGMVSDRTHTRLGRRHPFIYGALLPLPLLYFLLWNPPAWALANHATGFAYLTTLLIVFRAVLACFDIPSNAMVPELTRDYDKRTALMSARLSAAWVAGVSFTIAMYGYFLRPTAAFPDGVLNGMGYRVASWLGAALILVSVAVTAFGTHRHVATLREARPTTTLDLRAALKTVHAIFANGPFRALMLYAVAYRSTDGLFAALWIYLVTFFWLLEPSQIAWLTSMNLIGSFLAMAVTPWLSRNHDKRNIVLAANFASLITSCMPITLRLLGLLPDEWVFRTLLGVAIFDTFLIVVTVSLLASMIADLVEDVQKADGRRHEGAIISAQTFISKLSTASGTWIAGLVLTAIAFPQTARVADVPRAVADSLGLTYLLVLYASIALCGVLLLRYKLDRVTHEANVAFVARTAVESR